jgi:hypothetical protein
MNYHVYTKNVFTSSNLFIQKGLELVGFVVNEISSAVFTHFADKRPIAASEIGQKAF